MRYSGIARTITGIVLSVVFLAISVIPTFAEDNSVYNKMTYGLIEKTGSVSGDKLLRIAVLFVEPPAYKQDVDKEIEKKYREYNSGDLFIGDYEPEYIIPVMARACICPKMNEEYLNKLGALVEKAGYICQTALCVVLFVKASNVKPIAEFDFVSHVYEYDDEKIFSDVGYEFDIPFFIPDYSRWGDTTAEGYPKSGFFFDGTGASSVEGWMVGDVDFDGHVTAADARLALRASAKLWEPFTNEQFGAADIDGDSKITAFDARTILRMSAFLEPDKYKRRSV